MQKNKIMYELAKYTASEIQHFYSIVDHIQN